ncbi:hypothetical protein Q3A66_13100 [Hymenobacter sp. BT770]|uniref:hypothetical protein n=1 Tax=Hymenobacter sp. BT770 TaxID=2886942 RepID=UPI001D102370|nr:hypothetical protein [Hymenobacter sp. BT770]MCC3153859.1 hypothetical protein [Hymenobacter sp. BT770]MDO3416003.1 hypothetical protein [Hymenobacter sp. BT770]
MAQGAGPGVRGARAAALGNASVALAGEVWSMGNNVAGLGEIQQPTVGFYAENRYFSAALNVGALTAALPLGRPLGAVAAADGASPTQAVAAPAQAAWARNGVVAFEAQRFGGQLYNETRVGAGYGYRFGQISLGGRLDVLQVTIEGLGSRRVVLGTLGGQIEVVPQRLSFGALLYNLGQTKLASYQDERVPTVLKAGLAYRPSSQVLLVVETEKDVERAANFKVGLEYRPVPVLAARLGLASLTEQASAGIGVLAGAFHIDYAAAFQQALGFSQHLSVSKSWGQKAQ